MSGSKSPCRAAKSCEVRVSESEKDSRFRVSRLSGTTHNNLVRSEEPRVYKDSVREVQTEIPTEISMKATGEPWAFLTEMKK